MCTHDSHAPGLSGDFILIRTCARMIHMRHMCTRDSCKAGLFGNRRLIRTDVRMIHGRQDYLETLD